MTCRLPTIVTALCFLLGCAELAATLPSGEIFAAIFRPLCEALMARGLQPDQQVFVTKETQPVASTFALRSLFAEGDLTPADAERDDELDRRLLSNFTPTTFVVPAEGPCQWLPYQDTVPDEAAHDNLVLQLSNPIDAPIPHPAAGQAGVFAKLSIGESQSGDWYWIALEDVDTSWIVTNVYELPISDAYYH